MVWPFSKMRKWGLFGNFRDSKFFGRFCQFAAKEFGAHLVDEKYIYASDDFFSTFEGPMGKFELLIDPGGDIWIVGKRELVDHVLTAVGRDGIMSEYQAGRSPGSGFTVEFPNNYILLRTTGDKVSVFRKESSLSRDEVIGSEILAINYDCGVMFGRRYCSANQEDEWFVINTSEHTVLKFALTEREEWLSCLPRREQGNGPGMLTVDKFREKVESGEFQDLRVNSSVTIEEQG